LSTEPPERPPETHPLDFARRHPPEMRARAEAFLELMATRRSVRHFSSEPLPEGVLEACLRVAVSAPSGANKQPWSFVVVHDPELKRRIREAAEAEERAFYGGRAPERWLRDLASLGTDADKPFLEEAPALIVMFAQRSGAAPDERHYYVSESCGIAAGFLLAALHDAGLASLTHTPSPMGFLGELLQRPSSEQAYLLIPVGLPAPDCRVPSIARKPLDEVVTWL
jgi:iodotyrosine deiodinase